MAVGRAMKFYLAIGLISLSLCANARDRHIADEFRQTHICEYEACIVDHIIPLCAGGADSVYNMQYQEKSESYKKDAAERELCTWIRKAKNE